VVVFRLEVMSENGTGLQVNHLKKTFRGGSVIACDDVNLNIGEGELLIMLGPSGCGKTTTLRCIAGLEHPDNGDAIWIRGRNMTRVPPKDRNLAFVFQETAMFPNLSVRKNISFGLDMRRRLGKAEIDRRVEEAARMLRIEQLLERRPHELSGGQGQRVALGRAIVTEPNAFLLDEPLAALRVEMRTEIKLIQRKLNCTMIFVTHDQEEALTIGDKIAVMQDGVVQQVDTPHDVYHRPANLFVGTFIGLPPINRFTCTLQRKGGTPALISNHFSLPLPDGIAGQLDGASGPITLGVRPEFMAIGERGAMPGVALGDALRLPDVADGETASLQREGELLRDVVDDLRRRLDQEAEERRRLTLMLTDQRPWWRRWLANYLAVRHYRSTTSEASTMARTASIALKVEPDLKAAMVRAARDDRRTVSALIEMLLEEWLTEKGYLPSGTAVPDPATPAGHRKVS
jgi:multiple sugar transport system ATP-binding protein